MSNVARGDGTGNPPYSSVAFLISAFNAERFIFDAVQSALAQTHPNTSVWVLDDGSTDGTWDVLSQIEHPSLHRFRRENRGKPATMNELLDLCGTTYFLMQDADDLSMPDRAEIVAKRLDSDPEIALVLTGYEVFIDERRRYRISHAMSDAEVSSAIDSYTIPSLDPTMGGRVDVARKFRFNSSMPITEGIDLIWRIGEQSRVAVIGDVLYRYRIHNSSITKVDTARVTRQHAMATAAAMSRRTGRLVTEEEAIDTFGIEHDDANNMDGIYTQATRSALALGDRREALRIGVHSALRMRLGLSYVKPLFLAIGGPRFARWTQRRPKDVPRRIA
jgi:glycosyltransferase involved in cell wall biosynthesis